MKKSSYESTGFFSHFICLYGSEQNYKASKPGNSFLSCLYGSELKYYTSSPLLIKQNHLIFLLPPPFFILTFQLHYLSTTYHHHQKKGLNLLHPINKKSVTSFEITDFTNLPNN
ncbi:hypothetical protein BER14_07110 [Escherichia coli]|nr:hypothetical protein BER14_07110 [Escherichia coli]